MKKFRNSCSSSPEILINSSDEILTDPKAIADCFQAQFESVFSIPDIKLDPTSRIPARKIQNPLDELSITTEDVIRAIDEIDRFSASPKYDIPARLIKDCKKSLALPLALFWSKSFQEGKIPSKYKTQEIIPLHKKGPRTQASNHRPISLTSHIIKIFERVLREKLVSYLEANKIINTNQHGFRKRSSCLTQLLSHTSYILKSLSNGVDVDTIYVDYSKAFDKVDHRILLEKLKIYGIKNKYHKWIEMFLTGRKQIVRINNEFSYEAPVVSGVPQGSVLGPLLFVLYVNDMPNWIKFSQLQTFADDTKLCCPITSSQDRSKLQDDLNAINEWSLQNNMELNQDKYQLLCHRIKTTRQTVLFKDLPFENEVFTYSTQSGITLYPSPTVKDLGVIIDTALSWKSHIAQLRIDSIKMCCWILNVFKTRDKEAMLLLFNSLVRSKLEYCSELWDPHNIEQIKSIEQVQKRFTKRINGLKEDHYWQRLKDLGILSLQRRRERKTIVHMWKIKNMAVRNDVEFNFVDNPHRRTQPNLVLPPMPKITGKALSTFENSFVIRSTKLWNKLPKTLASETNYTTFLRKLDEWLKQIPDQPPVNGYFHNNKNSIVDYKVRKIEGKV